MWSGSEALRIGLIDRIGGYEDALQSAAQRAKLAPGYEVRMVEPELSVTQQLLLNLRARVAALVRAVGWRAPVQAREELLAPLQAAPVRALAREVARWRTFSARPGAYAYCFCRVE